MARAKAVAKKESANLVNPVRPDFMGDGNRGQEGVGVDDLTIPRLGLIQDLSPQRKKTAPEYIEGAEEGMLFNTVTNALYGDAVKFVPCFYRKEFVIWKSQNAGGGFNGAYSTESAARHEMEERDFNGKLDEKGEPLYDINDTGQQFGLLMHDDGTMEDIVISLSKSKRKVDRQFNTMIKMAGGDRFEQVFEVSAVPDQNAAGQDYFNFGVHPIGYCNEATYLRAEAMYESISSGDRDVNRDPEGGKPKDESEF